MKNKIPVLSLLISLFSLPAFPVSLFPDDSLSLFVAGDALATSQASSGFKGSENGFLRATLCHELSDHLSATVGVRGYSALPEPFLEVAALSWKNDPATLSGGFLTSRYGSCRFYKTYSTLSPLFEKPVIWDVYGFGGSGSLHSGNWMLNAGALMNDRESGSVHGYGGFESGSFSAGLLAGFQTYSPEDQDNNLTLGFESSAGEGPLRLHCAMRYLHGTAYSSTGTSYHIHGNAFDGFLEARIAPVRPLTIDLLGLYDCSRRQFNHAQGLTGIDCQWRLIHWWGVAGGGEWSNNDGVQSWAPELRTFVSPDTGVTQLSIGVKQSRTGSSSPLNQLTGNVCIAF